MIQKLIKKFKRLMAPKAFKKAVKHADHIRYTTGNKCLVILTQNGFKAYTKQGLKLMIKQKLLKGITIQNLEQKSFYITK